MKRFLTVLGVVGLVAGFGAVPAAADVDANPNAEQLLSVSCPDAGLFFEEIWVPAVESVPGLDLDGNIVGVAKSIWFTNDTGEPLGEPLFATPGRGLGNITTWCFWPDVASPTGFIGGDILFNANLRP